MLYKSGIFCFEQLHVGVEPGNEVGGLGVDTRIARISTARAPGHNTRQLVATHEGTTRVTLARVLTASVITSTDHGVSDVTLAIGLAAISIRYNRDIHLQKNVSKNLFMVEKHNTYKYPLKICR
jgi:hypothetical protein